MTRDELFSKGILKEGQEIQLVGNPASRAVIVNASHVKYDGRVMTYTKWAKELTGWKGVNIFRAVELVTGERLDTLRQKNAK